MPVDFSVAARTLALSPPPTAPSTDRAFTRPRAASRLSTAARRASKPLPARVFDYLSATGRTLLRSYLALSPLRRLLVALAILASLTLSGLFLAYSPRIFTSLGPVAQSWREAPLGWVPIWLAIFIAAFPPVLGYSTATTVAGFVYGFPRAWPLVATASTIGSLASFLASRTVLSGYVDRLVGRDARFVALGQVLRREGIGMLTMIRFCPLPYSLSNGFLATIPSIGPLSFALSTALASPKLLVHVFIGSRIALLVEDDASMPASTKALNYISMILGGAIGTTVGWLIYRRTMARAAEISLETAAAEEGFASPMAGEAPDGLYVDEGDPGDVLADVDDISLWEADGYWDEGGERGGVLSPAGSPLGFTNGNRKGSERGE